MAENTTARVCPYCQRPFRSEVLHLAGGVRLDLAREQAFRNGQEVRLSARGWELLHLLANAGSRGVNTKQVAERFVVVPQWLRTYISILRSRLGRGAIETLRGGYGYRLREEVTDD